VKVGDLVIFESDRGRSNCSKGIVVAKHPADGIFAASVDILWEHGEFHENCVPRILEVFSESQ